MATTNISNGRFCTECGTEVGEGTAFCTECGTPVPAQSSEDATTVLMPPVSAPTNAPAKAVFTTGETAEMPRMAPAATAVASTLDAASASQPQEKHPVNKGLIAALIIAAVVVVILVIALVVVLLPGGKEEAEPAPEETVTEQAAEEAEVNTSAPASSQDGENAISSSSSNDATEAEYENSARNGSSAPSSRASSDYLLPDSDTRYYTASELEYMSLYDLYLARNEIFARHGRLFNNHDLQLYFDDKPWYHGSIAPSDFDESVFNDYERKNAALMLEIEQDRDSPFLNP